MAFLLNMQRISKLALAGALCVGFAAAAAPARAAAFAPSEATDDAPRRVAIVIDDFGNAMDGTKEMLELPVPITVAVMPFLPTTKRDAEAAHRAGHEVIVHLPMEPVRGKRSWLGPGAITTDLSDMEIRNRVAAAIDDVPHARGVNNHMGSKATADARVMRIVMEVCRERGLYYLDSRTSPRSKAPEEAERFGVPLISNDLFLDDTYTSAHVYKQLRMLERKLERQSDSIVIGHVGPPGRITSAALRAAIPRLQRDARFVRVSELLPLPEPLWRW
ncbi:divergent polysaccharide deacetylase family protein [Paenibacillus sp.]|uniref:divergent polysaccharide deacetylase family protein n=1 Tax=Paenibacillus sp. TaxID=58172 RepID=UPI002D67EA28|nr:divergent polysaccharide deacetylase family protein [Paenibacillus sp.]HZG56269.1 divergent polysaccharide deacetylase family protein [Paenibacillus sp.]